MATTTIEKDILGEALREIREVEGESPQLISMELVLSLATSQQSEVYLDHTDLEFLDVYL